MLNFLTHLADANAASEALKSDISPLFSTIVIVAAVACLFFIIFGGYYYMTSAGNPDKLERAKKTLRNAIIGFVVILGAGGFVAIMQNAYTERAVQPANIPQVQAEEKPSSGIDIVNESIKNFIESVIQSVGEPIIALIKEFTTATPLMAQNGSVFNLWLIIVAIVDVLFLIVVALIGFRIMSSSVVGLEDVDIRSIVPQIILTFILANLSIFAIDAIISLSNAMVHALLLGSSNDIIWKAITGLITGVAQLNIGVLIFIAIAVILAVLLAIFYIQRLIILYVGAVLSPLIVLLWLLPSFRDFAVTAAKTYIVTIFVLFVHIVVLMLAVSLFTAFMDDNQNAFMSSLLAIATLLTLLKTSQAMNQLTMMSSGARGMKQLGETFVRGASHIASNVKGKAGAGAALAANAGNKALISSGARNVLPGAMNRAVAPIQNARNIATHQMANYKPSPNPASSAKPATSYNKGPEAAHRNAPTYSKMEAPRHSRPRQHNAPNVSSIHKRGK
jgi:hypothetical protein